MLISSGGSVDGITFRNLTVVGEKGDFKGAVYLNGRSAQESVKNVRFGNCTNFGEPIRSDSPDVRVGEFAEVAFHEN